MNANIYFFSEQEVADMFGVQKNTLAKWRIANSKGPKLPFVKLGRNIAYRKEAIYTWLEEHEYATTKEAKNTDR